MTVTWKIYALIDPQTGEPRYIGQTRRSLAARLMGHTKDRGSSYKVNWIKQLKNRQLRPIIRELYECFDGATADASEMFFINNFKDRGFRLTNLITGDGAGTRVVATETRAKLVAASRGNKRGLGYRHSPEAIAKIRAAHAGRRVSEATRAKMKNAQRGRQVSAETRAKMSAARIGIKPSAEAEAKRLESFKKTLALNPRGPRSAETRAKLRAANIGRKHTPETRAKIRDAGFGRVFSDATRLKISSSHMGKKLSPEAIAKRTATRKANNVLVGVKRSPETVAKMVATRKANAEAKQRTQALELTQCQPTNQADG